MATTYPGPDHPGRHEASGGSTAGAGSPTHDDRARVATILDDAVASGRITATEREQRLESVSTATTMGQLTALTTDLETDEPGAGTVNEDV